MTTSLFLAATDPRIEAIYTWVEQHPGSRVQLWGWEIQRRAALLSYGDATDAFGWSNWISKATSDPSQILPAFDQLELVVEDSQAAALNAALPGVFTVVANTPFG